jgi:hypothetical protein
MHESMMPLLYAYPAFHSGDYFIPVTGQWMFAQIVHLLQAIPENMLNQCKQKPCANIQKKIHQRCNSSLDAIAFRTSGRRARDGFASQY